MMWLNAALAFIVTMILFSTIVSAATESVHRIFHMRERGLRTMLGQLFDEIVWPRLASQLPALTAGAARQDFVAVLTRNRAVEEHGPARWFGYWFAPRSLTALPTLEFVQRLADTGVGKALAGAAAAHVDAAVDDLARQFERFGRDGSAYFTQRAKAMSITIAVVVAFALNVDAVRLFSSLLVNPDLTAKLVASGPAGVTVAPSAATGGAGEADIAGLLQDARQQAAVVAALGLPIGPAFFPWCRDQGVDRACAVLRGARDAGAGRTIVALWATWLVFTLLSGLLIGLGGPFWFDAFVRLSSFMQLVGGAGARGQPARATDSDAATAPSIAPPVTPAEVFRSSRARPAQPPRMLLSPAGRRL